MKFFSALFTKTPFVMLNENLQFENATDLSIDLEHLSLNYK